MIPRAWAGAWFLSCALWGCDSSPPRLPAPSGDRVAGQAALTTHDCGVCHSIPGVRGARGLVGPPLAGFGQRIYIAGRFPNTEAMLVRWIVDPPALDRSTAMPALGVSEEEARDMAAYLLSLR